MLQARLIASLATQDEYHRIHLVAMWYLWDDPDVLIPTNHATRKVRHLQRNPNAAVMIHDSRGGLDLRGLTLMGDVHIVGGAEALELNRRIHLKYLSAAERALPAVDRYLSADDVTLRLRPIRASTWDLRNTDAGAVLADGESRRLGYYGR